MCAASRKSGPIAARASAPADRSCSAAFGAADAMYAPVVSRFASYAIGVGAAAEGYMAAVMALPAFREWRDTGVAEPWVMPGNELD